MNFENQLRKNFTTFSNKINFYCFLFYFVSITVIINLIQKNMYKIESINYLNNTFSELNYKIFAQMEKHNSNEVYLNAIESNTLDKKLVSTNNYSFSQKMNLRYSYNGL